MTKLISAVCLVCTLFSQVSATELKGNPEDLRKFLHPNENIVSLMGEAKETAYSDKAVINLIITTEEDKLADALQKNTKLRGLIVSSLTSKGIKNENINTSKFSTSPQFGWFGDSPDSYEIVNRMSIAIFDEKQLVEIAKLSDIYKELELSTTTYEHTKKKEYTLKVKQEALNDALKQKAFYEKSLGITLITQNFRDASLGYGATRGADQLNRRVVVTASRVKRNKSLSYDESFAQSEPQPQSFDEVEYKATIYVDFVVVAKE